MFRFGRHRPGAIVCKKPTIIKAFGGVAPSARDPHRGEFLLGMGWERIVKRARGSICSR